MKEWKQICDEIFCAWLKFESDEYECGLNLANRYIAIYFYQKPKTTVVNTANIFKDLCTQSDIDHVLRMIEYYSNKNEVIENLDFQQEMQEEMLTAAERDLKAVEEVF